MDRMCADPRSLCLPANDVIGVQRAYGRKGSGALSRITACAPFRAADPGTPSSLTPVAIRLTTWWLKFDDARNFIVPHAPYRACLNVSGGVVSGNSADFRRVSSTCGSGAGQQFPLANVWRGMGSMCATAGSGPNAGSRSIIVGRHQRAEMDLPRRSGRQRPHLQSDQFDEHGVVRGGADEHRRSGEVLLLEDLQQLGREAAVHIPRGRDDCFGNWCMNVSAGCRPPRGTSSR